MSKISCDIIKDLLPLYIDGVCSSDSIDIIEEHLKDCPLCEAEFMNMQNNTDIKPEIDKDIDKAVKNANKKIKKGKKKVVVRTICISLVVTILLGIVSFFQIELFIAINAFKQKRELISSHQVLSIEKSDTLNYENKYVKCYIDEKHGKYKTEKAQDSIKLNWSDEKFIVFTNTRGKNFTIGATYKDFCKEANETYYDFYIPSFVLKKGIENLGFQTEFSPSYDVDLIKELITMEAPSNAFLLDYNDYSKACAYYYLHLLLLSDSFKQYFVGENETTVCWGCIAVTDICFLYYQPTGNIHKETMVAFSGFSEDEIKEIAESIVIK